MGDEQRVRPVPVHAGGRAQHEQAARSRLSSAVAVALVLSLASPAIADPPASTGGAPPSAGAPVSTDAVVEPAPFGPGARVEVTSTAEPLTVYVAKLDPTRQLTPTDSDFVKVGRTPLSFQLPPGTYRIEVEAPGISNNGIVLEMRGEPRRVSAHPGSEGLGTTGTLFTAVGVLGILGATAILVSGSKAPSNFNKTSVLIPMYAAGAVLLGAGIGMTIAAKTDIELPQPAPPVPPARGAMLTFGGTF